MTLNRQSQDVNEPSPADFADAAAWVARLHGPNHTAQVERGLRRWLEATPAHRAAFEAMTAGWEATGQLRPKPFPRVSRWQRAGYRDGFVRSALAMAALGVLVLGTVLYVHRTNGIATGIGEQRVVTLDDGTRVFLNTATRVVVRYDHNTRRVLLKAGEALFEVAKRPDWPFIVEAADQRVRALGTSFVVREEGPRVAVTLVEGRVTVSPVNALVRNTLPGHTSPIEPVTLVPGQRVTLTAHQMPRVDQPSIETVTAWRRGLVDFQDVPLPEAVAEMNRYSKVKLAVADRSAAGLHITGVFRAGDVSSFAAALARTYSIQVTEGEEEIRLDAASGAPAQSPLN
jgi:transmembrane sensor